MTQIHDFTEEVERRLYAADPDCPWTRGYQPTREACAQTGCFLCQRDLAREDATADFEATCERTVAPGTCTGCGSEAPELLPWTPRERLCGRCVDVQLDLLAKAVSGSVMVTR